MAEFLKFFKFFNSVREILAYTNHSTAQLIENWNNSQISYHIQISNLQTQHPLTSQSYSCLVIITLKIL